MPDEERHRARPVASWRFVPRPSRETVPAEAMAFRSELAEALRAGQGLGVEVGLSVTSGPDPMLTLSAASPETARWIARVLAPVYEAHQWRPESPTAVEAEPAGLERRARRVHAWPEALAAPGPSGALLDPLVDVLGATPPGAHLDWAWRSVPLARPHRWAGLPAPPPSPSPSARPGYGPPPERRIDATALPTARPLFGRLVVTLGFEAASPARRHARRVQAALEAVSSSERGNGLAFQPPRALFGWSLGRDRGIWLSVEEWERFWPRPGCRASGEPDGPDGGTWLLPLGRTATGGVVGPTVEPTQGRHLAVLGETGMGKSSLLLAVALRAFREGGGVVFDPLGETARSLRDELPLEFRHRLVWIAPEPGGVGVNALEGVGGGPEADPIRSERRLNDLVHALRRVRSGRYEDSAYWGPRLEEMVTRAVRAAAALPRGTLVDAHTLLATSARLGRPVPPSGMEAVRELADRIRDRPEDADGARRLLHEVVRSPVLVRMLCEAEPRRSTRELVAPGTIVLISGDAAVVGETTARYLLSVYLALVWSELLARAGEPKTFVFLDEAQWFSHESLGEMLRLGRRRNVHVVLATQAVAALPAAVGEAVWTNVSDFVAFRGSPEEAREFSRASRSVPAEVLLALPRGSAAVLLGKGHRVRWVRTSRRPVSGLPAPGRRSEPPEGVPGTPGDRPPEAPPEDSVRLPDRTGVVLRALLDRAAGLAPGEPLVVSLPQLRREVDPTGEGVRRVGSLLGRHGLLTRDEQGPAGPRWVISAEQLGRLRTVSSLEPAGDSRAPQPS